MASETFGHFENFITLAVGVAVLKLFWFVSKCGRKNTECKGKSPRLSFSKVC